VRYRPERDFPPYAYLPGRDPHPVRDPAGHSHGRPEPEAEHLPAEGWRENAGYLYGVDLYNHGFLWEAHEAWEGLWHLAKGRDPVQALHLQGLIQCAAACLKIPMDQPGGLEKLCAAGTEKLERVAREAGGEYMGLDVSDFVARMREFAASSPGSIEGRPRLELRVG